MIKIVQPTDIVVSEERVQLVVTLLRQIVIEAKITPQELALALNHLSFVNGMSQANKVKQETPNKIIES